LIDCRPDLALALALASDKENYWIESERMEPHLHNDDAFSPVDDLSLGSSLRVTSSALSSSGSWPNMTIYKHPRDIFFVEFIHLSSLTTAARFPFDQRARYGYFGEITIQLHMSSNPLTSI
jgi:hypothetical protein